jgi:translation initiation factor IF-1
MIEVEGTVEKIPGGGFYLVELENGVQVNLKLSGRLRQYKIRVLPGDRVKVELSTADLTNGYITYRIS